MTWFDLMGVSASVITAFATAATAYFMWRQNKNDVKVKIYKEDAFPGSNLKLKAINRGHKHVTLTKLGFKFPDSTYHYYPANPPFAESFRSGSLPIIETISSRLVAAELSNNTSLKGTVRIIGFCEDSAERRYLGNPIEIDIEYFRAVFKSEIDDCINRGS